MMKLVLALVLLLRADRHRPQHKEIYPEGGGGEAPEREQEPEAGPDGRLQCPVTRSPRTVESVQEVGEGAELLGQGQRHLVLS